VTAAASCQLLSFLAVAARARLDVVAYRDDAEGVMPEVDRRCASPGSCCGPTSRCGRRPTARLTHLVEVAHRECFIANSLDSEIVVEPTFERVA